MYYSFNIYRSYIYNSVQNLDGLFHMYNNDDNNVRYIFRPGKGGFVRSSGIYTIRLITI